MNAIICICSSGQFPLLRPPQMALARMRDDLDEGMYRHNIARDE